MSVSEAGITTTQREVAEKERDSTSNHKLRPHVVTYFALQPFVFPPVVHYMGGNSMMSERLVSPRAAAEVWPRPRWCQVVTFDGRSFAMTVRGDYV